ncbi:MAG TPA: adenylate kinase [Clostridia bacterium]|nr:adenylate kinase [Clostridia bacterium]
MGKRFVLIGAPGSGKGTWSKILSDACSLTHISSGDLFRRELADDSPLGREVRSYVEQGALVPDELTIQLMQNAFAQGVGREGFILDGFPRTMSQAEGLDRILAETGVKLDAVIALDIDEEILIQRTLARRVCGVCGQPYNTTVMRPAKEGICDRCGGEVVRRSDDTEETLRRRVLAYQKETAPLVDYYRERSKLIVFENNGPPDEAKQQELFRMLGYLCDGEMTVNTKTDSM